MIKIFIGLFNILFLIVGCWRISEYNENKIVTKKGAVIEEIIAVLFASIFIDLCIFFCGYGFYLIYAGCKSLG